MAQKTLPERLDATTPGKSIGNSTTTTLTAGSTFTGDWVDVSEYVSVVTACKSDVAGTLYMEFSNTGSGAADSTLTYDVAANINEVHRLTITRQYYRTRYLNGGSNQTSFEISTLIGAYPSLSAPLNLTLGQDADAIAVRAIDSEIDIAEGKRAGYQIVNKFGRDADIDTATTPEDIWDGSGVYTGFPLSDDELVTIVSSSVNDTAAGSGARTVMISGLDTNGLEQSETLTLNGTSLVDSANTYTRVNRAVVMTSGNSNQAFNAGTLTVAHKVTTANIFIVMPAGVNQSQVAAYTIPAGKSGYLRRLNVSIQRSATATADGALWVRNNGESPRLIRLFSVSQDGPLTDVIYGGLCFPALTDIAVRITAISSNNTAVQANFDLIVVDD